MTTEHPQQQNHTPPAGPPPKEPLLKSSVALPYSVDLDKLASQGWCTLDITNSPSDPLHSPFSELFEASAQFFNLPEEQRLKYQVPVNSAGQVSEEGYSFVQGEKRMITLRREQTTPSEFELREKAEKAWRASGLVMQSVLAAIEQSLGMNEGVLVRVAEKQLEMPMQSEGGGGGNVATLMRMFRYERPSPHQGRPADPGTGDSRIVAEPHKDLGLLTIVVGHSPGLECWNPDANEWVSCETKEGLNASIMTGQQLVKFTNGRYVAGRHRVFVHPSSSLAQSSSSPDKEGSPNASPSDLLTNPSHRFSLVHALRGHYPVIISSSEFETPITGTYPAAHQFQNVKVDAIYKAISDAHWNVNISVAERRKQERRLREKAEKERKEMEKAEKAEKAARNGKKAKDKRKKSTRRFTKLVNLFRRTRRQPAAVS